MGLDLSPAPMKEVSIGSATAGLYRREIRNQRHADGGGHDYICSARHRGEKGGLQRTDDARPGGYAAFAIVERGRALDGSISRLFRSVRHGPRYDSSSGGRHRRSLARIIGDVATLSVKLSKPLSARLLPVAGAKPGDRTGFDDPNMVNTTYSAACPSVSLLFDRNTLTCR